MLRSSTFPPGKEPPSAAASIGAILITIARLSPFSPTLLLPSHFQHPLTLGRRGRTLWGNGVWIPLDYSLVIKGIEYLGDKIDLKCKDISNQQPAAAAGGSNSSRWTAAREGAATLRGAATSRGAAATTPPGTLAFLCPLKNLQNAKCHKLAETVLAESHPVEHKANHSHLLWTVWSSTISHIWNQNKNILT